MELAVVAVPYRYDEHHRGPGKGPVALIESGLHDVLSRANHHVVEVTEAALPEADREPGRTAVNIGKLGSHTAQLVAEARAAGRGVLVLAGDDTASIGVIAGLQRAHGAGAAIGLIWIDAHGDFNTPETSVSGILAGMPVAILAGLAGPLWRGAAGLAAPIPTDRMLIAGVRDLDERESQLMNSTSVQVLTTDQVRDAETLERSIERTASRCDILCVHFDADVLDPRLVPSASTPSEHGLEIDEAARLLETAFRTQKVGAWCMSSINPGAGQRGRTSVNTVLKLIELALPAWETTPVLSSEPMP